MRLNLAWMREPKTYNSIEEAEAERDPQRVRSLRLVDVDLDGLNGRLRRFSRLESLYFQRFWRREHLAEFAPELRAEILELGRLRSFTLLNVAVSEFPLWLAPSPKLECLMLRGTDILEIPADVRLFSRLRVLRLGNNDLFRVPVEIAELRKLEWLNLPDTFVSKIPLPILQLPQLRALCLANTNFTPQGVAETKAHFPHASVWPAHATRVPRSAFYLNRKRTQQTP